MEQRDLDELGDGREQYLRARRHDHADRRGREFARTRALLRSSATVFGTIVALTENRERDENSYFPKIEFRTHSGRGITFQSAMGSSAAAKRVGDSVTVRYRLDQPHVAEVDAFLPLWGLTLLFGALGGVFALVGAGILTGVLAV